MRGDIAPFSIGTYTYAKHDMSDGEVGDFIVDVFPMHFSQSGQKNWPERGVNDGSSGLASRSPCVTRRRARNSKLFLPSFDPALVDIR